ncbi:MAG: lamin tail domain-containing protein, partial [Verrucomicrobiales bacterium]
ALKQARDERIDADQWMRTFAQCSLNGTDDILGRIWEHNFRFYVRPTDGKIIALQWDLDRTFRLATSGSLTSGLQSAAPTTNRDGVVHPFAKIFNIPQYRRLFDGHLEDQIDTTFNSTYAAPWASHLSTHSGDNLNTYVSYITNRANFLLGSLPASVPFAITTNGGASFDHPGSVVELVGEAWIDVFSVEVNGVDTHVNWVDAETWHLSVPISPGTNALTLTALDNRGTVVGTDTISVTNTSPIELADASNTSISELHYHPADPGAAEIAAGFDDADLFEFVELTNTGAADVDFTNVSFTEGVAFTFANGTILAPGQRLVVVADPMAFEFRYGAGTATIAGTYTGNFRNSGEQVLLEAADTSAIADFIYGDSSPWPDDADGEGYSLTFAGGDPSDPLAWRSSTVIGGNPGATDSTPYLGGDLIEYALATSTPTPEISDEGYLLKAHVRLAADEVDVSGQFSADLETWTTVPSTDVISRTNHGDGTATWTFRSPISQSTTARRFGRVLVTLRP